MIVVTAGAPARRGWVTSPERTWRRGCALLNVSFFGVRGSTPCPCDENRRYGGNTSCVQLEAPGHDTIVFDLGTGLRRLGQTLPTDGSFRGAALVTHMHWDHVQGLPFFGPILAPGAKLDIYGPRRRAARWPTPSTSSCARRSSRSRSRSSTGRSSSTTSTTPTSRSTGRRSGCAPVPHVGANNGYRVEIGRASVAYIADHQMPHDGSHRVSDDVLELCDGADPSSTTPSTRSRSSRRSTTGGTARWTTPCSSPTSRRPPAGAVPPRPGPRRRHARRPASSIACRAAEPTGLTEVISAYEGLTVSFGG